VAVHLTADLTIQSTGGSLVVDAPINLDGHALAVNASGGAAPTGVVDALGGIAGAGTVEKLGFGGLALPTGASSSASTFVHDGALRVDGSHPQPVVVDGASMGDPLRVPSQLAGS